MAKQETKPEVRGLHVNFEVHRMLGDESLPPVVESFFLDFTNVESFDKILREKPHSEEFIKPVLQYLASIPSGRASQVIENAKKLLEQ